MVCLPEHRRNQSMDMASGGITEEEQAWEEEGPSDEEEIEDGGRPSDETKGPWEVKKKKDIRASPPKHVNAVNKLLGHVFFP